MRWSVEVVLDLVGSGMTMDEIIAEHPELEREDIVACLPACLPACLHCARCEHLGQPAERRACGVAGAVLGGDR
jgi:hypothetical protein